MILITALAFLGTLFYCLRYFDLYGASFSFRKFTGNFFSLFGFSALPLFAIDIYLIYGLFGSSACAGWSGIAVALIGAGAAFWLTYSHREEKDGQSNHYDPI